MKKFIIVFLFCLALGIGLKFNMESEKSPKSEESKLQKPESKISRLKKVFSGDAKCGYGILTDAGRPNIRYIIFNKDQFRYDVEVETNSILRISRTNMADGKRTERAYEDSNMDEMPDKVLLDEALSIRYASKTFAIVHGFQQDNPEAFFKNNEDVFKENFMDDLKVVYDHFGIE